MSTVLLRDLSPARRRLIEIIARVGFGHIEALHLRNGEPVALPETRLVRSIRTSGTNASLRQLPENAALKEQAVAALREFDRTRDGVIRQLRFADGLPVALEMESALTL